MRSREEYRGPWADDPRAAITAALDEVGVDPNDGFVQVEYADAVALVPTHGQARRIEIDVTFSDHRQQYKAVLRREA